MKKLTNMMKKAIENVAGRVEKYVRENMHSTVEHRGTDIECITIPHPIPQAMVFKTRTDDHYIFITTGLKSLFTEDEVRAAVLHELGHVEHNHLDQIRDMQLAWVEGLISGVDSIQVNDIHDISKVWAFVYKAIRARPKRRIPEYEVQADGHAAAQGYGSSMLQGLKKLRASRWIKLLGGGKELDMRIEKLEKRVKFDSYFLDI